MTAVYLIPDPAAGAGIPAIQLWDDGIPRNSVLLSDESQTGSATVTEHPIESGVQVTDNVRPDPESVSFTFSVSFSPTNLADPDATPTKVPLAIPTRPLNVFSESALIGAAVGAIGDLLFPKPPPAVTGPVYAGLDPVSQMHADLRAVKDAAAQCDVLTTTGVLSNMVITSVKVSRKEPGGAEFTVELKQIFTVNSSTVDAPRPLQPRGQSATSKGAQAPAPAIPPAPQTALSAIFGGP